MIDNMRLSGKRFEKSKNRKQAARAARAPMYGDWAAMFLLEGLESRQLLSATLSVTQSLMVFNAVKNSTASPTETLTLTDTGDATLSLNGVSIVDDPSEVAGGSARFALLNSGSIPSALAPGQSFTLQLDYSAIATGIDYAILDISSNDPNTPLQQVSLHGIGTAGLGGSNQPSLKRILEAYDIPDNVGEADTATVYPEPPAAGSQEVSMQQMVKAGSGPVTIDVLASFTNAESKPYILGYYTPGDPADKTQLFYTPTSEYQSVYVQPDGITSFDPGSASFGMYFYSSAYKYYGYSEDALNTWDTTDDRKFRFFPMENPDGTVVPNTYVMTSTEYDAPAGYDFTNIVAIISNVEPAPNANTGPVINVTHSNAIPGSDTLMFNVIQNQNPSVGDTVHNQNTVTISNTGTASLIVNSVSLSDTTNWELVNPPTFPLTIADGGSVTFTVQFIATTKPSVPYNETTYDGTSGSYGNPEDGGVWSATLTINSNDPVTPTTALPLEGYWQYHSENINEPSLQTIVNLMAGYTTDINSTPYSTLPQSIGTNSTPSYYGDEVVSAYWQEADSTQPVSVIQLNAFHTQGSSGEFYWYTQGSSSIGSAHQLIYDAGDSGQSLFPLSVNSTVSAANSFSSTGTFGFIVYGPAGPTEYSDDSLNTDSGGVGGGHGMRFFPVYDANGNLVPNTYICTIDFFDGSGTNFDFQDMTFIISNIRPVSTGKSTTSPQTQGAAPAVQTVAAVANNDGSVSLEWTPIFGDSSLQGYNVYSSQSPTTGFTKINSSLLTTPSFTDSYAVAGTTLYYRVTAVDSVGESLGTQTDVTTTGTAPTTLQSISINETPVGSVTTVTPNSAYIVTAGGPGVSANADGFRFLYTEVSGNFDVAVRVNSITVAGNYATAGIMARTLLSDNSPNVYMSASPVNYRFKYRTTTGGTENPIQQGTTNYPNVWVRLTRVGNVFTGYYSVDGSNWTELSSITVTMPNIIYLGLAVASNDSVDQTTANLSNYGNTASLSGPIVYPYAFSTTSGQATPVNVLNSSDFDNTGTIEPGTISIVTQPTSGGTATVDPTTGLVTYTSPSGFVGTDTFTYTVADSNGAVSSPVTVTVTVTASGPSAVADSAQVVSGQPVTINVLGNDTDSTGTLNPASVLVVSAPANGTVSVNSTTGAITYTSNAGFSGTDTFTYSVADYNGAVSSPATVTVTVTPATSATGPVTNPLSTTAVAGVSTTIDVLSSDTDAAATLLPSSVKIVTAPNHGGTATVDTSTGEIIYIAASGFAGTETFAYTVKDSAGNVSAATVVTVLVSNPALAPVASNSSSTTSANTATTVTVANEVISTVGLNLSTLDIVNAPSHGTATFDASTGVITYTPDSNYVGPDSYQYTVKDNNGHTSNVATVTVSTGVTVGTGNDRSLSLTAANNVATTIALSRGTADVLFSAPGMVSVDRLGRATVVPLSGNSVGISGIQLSGTTAASVLTVAAKGGSGDVAIGGISDSSVLREIVAPRGQLSGTIDLAGVTVLDVASLTSAHVTLGTGFPAGASLVITAGATDSTVTSSAPIKLLRSASWTGTATSSTITAPSIGTLLVPGAMSGTVSLTGTGVDLNVAEVGQPGTTSWHLSGSGRTLVFSGAFDGTLSATGSVNQLVVRKGGLDGTLSVGSINAMTVSGTLTANITAGSINLLHDVGNVTGSTVNVTGNFNTLSVSGQVGQSTIDVGGSTGNVVAGSLVGTTLEDDVASGKTLSNVSAANIGVGVIRNVHLTARATPQFSNSVIMARTITALSLGTVDVTGLGGTEGIAASTITSLSANVDGTAVRQRAATLPAYLATNSSLFSEFQVKLV